MAWGSYDSMIDSVVKNVGHVQVQNPNYSEDNSINELVAENSGFVDWVKEKKNIEIERDFLNGALAIGEDVSKPVLLDGIDLSVEDQPYRSKVVQGSFFTANQGEVVVSQGLAKLMDLKVGDEVSFLVQGYRSQIGADTYSVVGIIKVLNPTLNLRLALVSILDAQELNSAENLLTSYKLKLKDTKKRDEVITLQGQIKDYLVKNNLDAVVLTYNQIQKELSQQIRSDSFFSYFLLFIIYMIMGFGILATLLAMTLERKKEIATLNAIGMSKKTINLLILVEAILMGLLGIFVSALVVIPVVAYFHFNPIPLTNPDMVKTFESYGIDPVVQFSIYYDIFYYQLLFVFLIVFASSLLPRFIVNRIDITETLKIN